LGIELNKSAISILENMTTQLVGGNFE